MERVSTVTPEVSLISFKGLDLSLDFSGVLELLGLWDTAEFFDSLDISGILCPLVIVDARASGNFVNGPYKLVDGFKRLAWARRKGLDTIPVTRAQMTDRGLLAFLLSKYVHLLKTCVARALFLKFLLQIGIDDQAIIDVAMRPLGLQAYKGLLEKHLRIADLPEELLTFCHKKDFSLKRCLNFTYQPRQLLVKIMALEDRISLSASFLQELCDSISEIMKRNEMAVEEFFQIEEVKEVLGSDIDRSSKTNLFRQVIRRLRYPILSKIQRELKEIEKEYLGPFPFEVKWDESLENRRLRIIASIKHIGELSDFRSSLSNPKAEEGIKRLLSYF